MEVHRTLVKSPPELWAEVSDVDALTRHLAAFGDITIKRVVPESTVAWEGELASGTVELSASGWGTKVTLRAEPVEVAAPEPEPEPEPVAVVEPEPEAEPVVVASAPRRRWRFWSRAEIPAPPAPTPDPTPPTPTPQPTPAPPDPNPPQIAFDPGETEALLTKVLDDLGQAHHRPFQR